MRLKEIRITNFKNIEAVSVSLSPKINYISGENGAGKTNFVDAVHLLCLTKSFVSSQEQYLLQHGSSFYQITGTFENSEKQNTKIQVLNDFKNGKKIKTEDKAYSTFSGHIGKFPLMLSAPQHHQVITGNSIDRRRFLDRTISQYDKSYLKSLSEYNKILINRNTLLKTAKKTGYIDGILLQTLTEKLIPCGTYIYEARKTFLEILQPLFVSLISKLWGGPLSVSLTYRSDINEKAFKSLLEGSSSQDKISGRTHFGVHNDEIQIQYENGNIKRTGSQGQQKITLLCLVLSSMELFINKTNKTPLVILDDLFDKIDNKRAKNIIEYLKNYSPRLQVFITSTLPELPIDIPEILLNKIEFGEGNLKNSSS